MPEQPPRRTLDVEPPDHVRPYLEDPLAGLVPEHPRLFATVEGFDRLRERAAGDRLLGEGVRAVVEAARAELDEPVIQREIPDGKRMLWASRKAVDRMYRLGFAWRMTAERCFAERGWRELESVCGFEDWNPDHFLDTAEMAHAVAVGYDWLHDGIDEEARRLDRQAMVREALVRLAVEPALCQHRGEGWAGRVHNWHVAANNWNVVCNGGLLTVALTLGDELPVMMGELARHCVSAMPICLEHFAPDGGWIEGPGYWSYTMRYLTAALGASESAVGHRFGLDRTPGLERTARFMLACRMPDERSMIFSDFGGGKGPHAGSLVWLGRAFDDPAATWLGLGSATRAGETGPTLHHATGLLWLGGSGDRPATVDPPPGVPLDLKVAGTELFSVRQSWTDPDAAYLAAQCGQNLVGHNRLDLGSFAYVAGGATWFSAPPSDDYNQPGFFGAERYTYYRNRAEGHNTLVLRRGGDDSAWPGPDQDPQAGGRIMRFDSDAEGAVVEMDLTPAYAAAGVERVLRRFAFDRPSGGVQLTDHVVWPGQGPGELPGGDVWWFAHTQADVAIADDGRSATLTRGGRTLRVVLHEPAGARLAMMPARPLPGSPDPADQNPNDGSFASGLRRLGGRPALRDVPDASQAIRKLAVHVAGVGEVTLRVSWVLDAVKD